MTVNSIRQFGGALGESSVMLGLATIPGCLFEMRMYPAAKPKYRDTNTVEFTVFPLSQIMNNWAPYGTHGARNGNWGYLRGDRVSIAVGVALTVLA